MKPIAIRRVRQKVGHCGPACLEMLFSFYDLDISQDAIAIAAGVSKTVSSSGSRIDQLATAVETLAPNYVLLAKYNSIIEDIALLIQEHRLPVSVEWQGMFIDGKGRYFEEGHYSVIVSVNQEDECIIMVDPEERSALSNGEISIQDFEKRWWENNDVPLESNPAQNEIIRNDHLLFVLVRKKDSQQLLDLGLQPASLSLMWVFRSSKIG